MNPIQNLSRREFMTAGAVAGTALVLGCSLGFKQPPAVEATTATGPDFSPNAFLTIGADDTITVTINKTEMGQGIRTGFAMLVAEELEADWTKVKVVNATANQAKYGFQGTGGSGSSRSAWDTFRKAGATARVMLAQAAAKTWSVPESECKAENGFIVHSSGKKLSYGKLVEAASGLPVPDAKTLSMKASKDFKIIGTRVKRIDNPAIVDGSAVYGMDMRVPGMSFATIVHCPTFGGKPASFDDSKAKSVKGVRKVVQTESGVAVVADNTWSAMQGAKALVVKWDDGPHTALSSESIRKMFEEKGKSPGLEAKKEGNFPQAFEGAAKKVEAVYELPFLNHATMEPQNCTAHVTADGCEIWAPTQFPNLVVDQAKRLTGLDPSKIKVNITLLGGGFGRRIESDYAADAIEVAKQVTGPVQVTWSREEDMQHGWYRPASMHILKGAIAADGACLGMMHRLVAPSIGGQRQPDGGKGVDGMAGIASTQYGFPNFLAEYVRANTGVPLGYWRAVYDSQNGFVQESFMDELAHAAGKDPVEFRRGLLGKSPRLRGVLDLAAEKAGWGKELPKGVFRGVASHFAFGAYCAQVAEVSVTDGEVKIHRIVCAVDVGTVINPNMVEAQMEGCIVYGLSAALFGEITVADGKAVQTNFHNYPVMRIKDMPKVEVHIVKSEEAVSGAGEPGLPPAAPAVCNAIFAATGKRIRKLPIRFEE